MKIRQKNIGTTTLITYLSQKGLEQPIWKAVAKGLNRPRQKAYTATLLRLSKYADNRTVVVPGSVLGTGEVTRPLTVAALRFSRTAREKIQKAGGSCLSIEELVQKNPAGTNVKIMG